MVLFPLEREPGFAPAWAGLSHAYWLLAWYGQMPSDEAMPQCRDAALRTGMKEGMEQGFARLDRLLAVLR